MHRPSLAGLTALALTGGCLLSTASPAQAADPTVLYVRQDPTACSDTGPGTLAQPYCTISAAAALVTASQTVDVGRGTYPERVTIVSSGTPSQPITFLANSGAVLSGATAGFDIDGQHDIVLKNFAVNGAADKAALDLRNASGITVQGGNYTMAKVSTAPVIRLAAVTDSTLAPVKAGGQAVPDGIVMDAATTGVVVRSAILFSGASYNSADHSAGVRVDGPGNTILANTISGFTGAGIELGAGVTGTVVANNQVNSSAGYGIHNRGASQTAIANNTIHENCLDGIRVDGASTGVSVQNNVLILNGLAHQSNCDPVAAPTADIGLYDDTGKHAVVDYNNTSLSGSHYSWNGTPMGLSAFRTVSGQSAHDKETSLTAEAQDSANSAAPGYQPSDRAGVTRADNPAVPNTGVGPIAYADRGATEAVTSPVARFNVTPNLDARAVTLDASASIPGFVPITSYEFNFGDGTIVTQATPVAPHTYAATGTYTVTVKVSGSDGRSGSSPQSASVLPRIGTIELLAASGLRYVTGALPGNKLAADQTAPGVTAQFDLADAGNGQVALFSRATHQYASGGTGSLQLSSTAVGSTEQFYLIRNADGTVSLRSTASNMYVSSSPASPQLTVNAATIGLPQKFYQVTNVDRSFKARVNSRFVTAESKGTKPLINNRTSVGPWERFDLVDLGNGQIGIFARADNKFVSAESKGTLPLIANRATVGAWERFTLVPNSDGTVSLKAAINARYVTADSAGVKPLIANRTTIGPWEKFTLG